MNRFDEAVTRADVKHESDMQKASMVFLHRLDCERRGVDPDLPLLPRWRNA